MFESKFLLNLSQFDKDDKIFILPKCNIEKYIEKYCREKLKLDKDYKIIKENEYEYKLVKNNFKEDFFKKIEVWNECCKYKDFKSDIEDIIDDKQFLNFLINKEKHEFARGILKFKMEEFIKNLFEACETDDIDKYIENSKFLIYYDCNFPEYEDVSIVFTACKKRSFKILKQMINDKVYLIPFSEKIGTPLLQALKSNDLEIVNLLLSGGAELLAADVYLDLIFDHLHDLEIYETLKDLNLHCLDNSNIDYPYGLIIEAIKKEIKQKEIYDYLIEEAKKDENEEFIKFLEKIHEN